MRILTSVIAFVLAAAVAVPAAAQGTGTSSSTQKPSTSKPALVAPMKPKVAFRVFGVGDFQMMTASQSFDAITGSSMVIGYGGGGEVINLAGHLYLRGAFMTAPSSGERAFALNGEVISTGLGVDIGMQTIELGAGLRFPVGKKRRVAPYFGGGVLFVKYSEKSSASAEGDVNESFTGYAFQGGLDFALSKRAYAAFEGQYRLVPDALGQGGVSAAFNETDLGGFTVRVMVGVRFGK